MCQKILPKFKYYYLYIRKYIPHVGNKLRIIFSDTIIYDTNAYRNTNILPSGSNVLVEETQAESSQDRDDDNNSEGKLDLYY